MFEIVCVLVMFQTVSARPAPHSFVFRLFVTVLKRCVYVSLCVYSDIPNGCPWCFFFTVPDRNAGFPLGQHERTGRTGGQTGGPGQTDCRTVGQTDGSGGRPADGGPEYSLPARLELECASGSDRSRTGGPPAASGLASLAVVQTTAVRWWPGTSVSPAVTRKSAAGPGLWPCSIFRRAGLWPCSIFRPPT